MQGAQWSGNEAQLSTSSSEGHCSNAAVGAFSRRHLKNTGPGKPDGRRRGAAVDRSATARPPAKPSGDGVPSIKGWLMARFFLILSIVSFFLWGCAATPLTELKTARTALARAYAAEAPRYAPFLYDAAQAALKQGELQVKRGNFDAAKTPLAIAATKANQALALTRKGKKAQRLARAQAAAERAAAEAAEKARRKSTPAPKPKPAPPIKTLSHTRPAHPVASPPSPIVKYTVSEGETLWTIAARKNIYFDPLLWPLIYKANRDQIKDPRQIFPGQVLNIPRDVSPAEKEDARNMARKSHIFPVEILLHAGRTKKLERPRN